MNLDQTVQELQKILAEEQQAGRINSLEALHRSKVNRRVINERWHAIQSELKSLRTAIDELPEMPVESEIQWAQAVRVMPNLVFLEVDTTGLDAGRDEITRIVVLDGTGTLVDDILINPERSISEEASQASGLRNADVSHAPVLREVWERIQKALRGRYVVSFSWRFDTEHLNTSAQRHQLPPLLLIGDDLQRHCTQYYHREYSLSLETLCDRIGHSLPRKPRQDAQDRALGQYHLLQALAAAVSDVRPPAPNISATNTDDTDALGDLDDHPF